MTTIKIAFQKAKQKGYGCLIGYVTAGYPTPELTPKIADALIKGGVDILELGLPFSDPIADGPTIQNASLQALNAGTTPNWVLNLAREIKSQHTTPIIIMSYYNPLFQNGLDKYLSQAKIDGVDGFIIPDLPVEEADEFRRIAKTYNLDTIFLASPATSKQRLKKIIDASTGFLYLVSRFGVTGARTAISNSTVELIRKVQPLVADKLPLAVGFGISKPEHVKTVISSGADAVIVGSAFINLIANNQETMLLELKSTAEELKSATQFSTKTQD